MNRVFQGIFLGISIYKIQNLSSPRVFKIFTRGFRRNKGADIAKKTLGTDFLFFYSRIFHYHIIIKQKNFFLGFLLIKNHKIKKSKIGSQRFFSQYQHFYYVENRE